MSHSPTAETAANDPDREYLEGWSALYELLRQGKSWSGHERNNCFLNTGDGRFADISAVAGFDFGDDGRALAAVDWDRDGDLDLWLSNRTGPQVRFLRNRGKSGHPSLAVRLRGAGLNRDAIGARAELHLTLRDGGERALVRGLRAGEGYLAQSSKWLHFGLGASEPRIDKLVVRWPDGAREEIRGLAPGGRYLVVQGTGEAEEVPPLPPVSRPAPEAAPASPPPGRTVLATPLPLPELAYLSAAGEVRPFTGPVATAAGRPLLLNLWASWCGNCRGELTELAEQAGRLRRQGLEVVAVSVDEAEARPDAAAFLEEIRWPFASGYAPEALLDVLAILRQEILDQPGPMVLPTSFLIDGEGRLTTLYRGPAGIPTLLADTGGTAAGGDPAVPFPGRWIRRPSGRNYQHLADMLRSRGYPQLAVTYLETATEGGEAPVWARERHADSWQEMGRALAAQGRYPQAIEAFEKGLAAEPGRASLHDGLGAALQGAGLLEEAIAQYREALRLEPENGATHFNLGLALAISGNLEEAEAHFHRALETTPPQHEAHRKALYNLGVAADEHGRPKQAEELTRRALALKADDFEALRFLGVLLHRDGRLEEAIAAYEKAQEANPEDARTAFYLGQAYVAAGDRGGVERQLERLRQLKHPSARRLEKDLASMK